MSRSGARTAASDPPSHLHELDSDGERSEGDTLSEHDIDEDDIDDPNAPATAKPVQQQPQASIATLPSYQSLMSSLATGERPKPSTASPAASTSDSLSPGAPESYPGDEDENHGFIEDAVGGGEAVDGEEDEEDAELKVGDRQFTFEEMYSRATRLESKGLLRKAAHYYLHCLERFRFSHQHQQLIAMCLRRLGDICYANKKFKEALQFRTAERMIYESNLLRVVKSDAEKEAAQIEAAKASGSAPVSPTNASSSASGTAAPPSDRNIRIMQMRSVDPTPIIRTPITPKSLIQEEERALTYERLAKVFFDERNLDMAKAYAIKAIELRRRIKSKWGDPSTMDTEQLLLHQLGVMGREQYEETLRRFKGGEDATKDAALGEEETKESDADGEPSQERAEALRVSMAKSLQVLASGQLNAKPAESSSSSSSSRPPAAASSSSSSGVRQRTKSTKQVAFDEKTDRADDAAAVASASPSSSGDDLSSVVVERPFNRRALVVSLTVGLAVIALAYFLITRTFHDVFFPLRPQNRFGAPK